MTEEEQNNTINSDDLDALRELLHSVKGLSVVSSIEPISTDYED
jgi:hypothetical protein